MRPFPPLRHAQWDPMKEKKKCPQEERREEKGSRIQIKSNMKGPNNIILPMRGGFAMISERKMSKEDMRKLRATIVDRLWEWRDQSPFQLVRGMRKKDLDAAFDDVPPDHMSQFLTDVESALTAKTPEEFLRINQSMGCEKFGCGAVIITSVFMLDAILVGDCDERKANVVLSTLNGFMSKTKGWLSDSPYVSIMRAVGLVSCVERIVFSEPLWRHRDSTVREEGVSFLHAVYHRSEVAMQFCAKHTFSRLVTWEKQLPRCSSISLMAAVSIHLNTAEVLCHAPTTFFREKTRAEVEAFHNFRRHIRPIFDMICAYDRQNEVRKSNAQTFFQLVEVGAALLNVGIYQESVDMARELVRITIRSIQKLFHPAKQAHISPNLWMTIFEFTVMARKIFDEEECVKVFKIVHAVTSKVTIVNVPHQVPYGLAAIYMELLKEIIRKELVKHSDRMMENLIREMESPKQASKAKKKKRREKRERKKRNEKAKLDRALAHHRRSVCRTVMEAWRHVVREKNATADAFCERSRMRGAFSQWRESVGRRTSHARRALMKEKERTERIRCALRKEKERTEKIRRALEQENERAKKARRALELENERREKAYRELLRKEHERKLQLERQAWDWNPWTSKCLSIEYDDSSSSSSNIIIAT
jgi:hypothetical protein